MKNNFIESDMALQCKNNYLKFRQRNLFLFENLFFKTPWFKVEMKLMKIDRFIGPRKENKTSKKHFLSSSSKMNHKKLKKLERIRKSLKRKKYKIFKKIESRICKLCSKGKFYLSVDENRKVLLEPGGNGVFPSGARFWV